VAEWLTHSPATHEVTVSRPTFGKISEINLLNRQVIRFEYAKQIQLLLLFVYVRGSKDPESYKPLLKIIIIIISSSSSSSSISIIIIITFSVIISTMLVTIYLQISSSETRVLKERGQSVMLFRHDSSKSSTVLKLLNIFIFAVISP